MKIESKIECSAKRENVLDVLTDYPSHPEIFSSIVSSEIVAQRDHETDVLQVLQSPANSICHAACVSIPLN